MQIRKMRITVLCYSIPLTLTVMLALGEKQMVMIERAFSNQHTLKQRDSQPYRETLPDSLTPRNIQTYIIIIIIIIVTICGYSFQTYS